MAPTPASNFFYRNGRLVTQTQGAASRTVLRLGQQPLADLSQTNTNQDALLLACDVKGSVHSVQEPSYTHHASYTAYGYSPMPDSPTSLLHYNAERYDSACGCYLLGNGYRAYSPSLTRFNSPDHASPFGAGGINAYAYCLGDPINYSDPSGASALQWFAHKINSLKGRNVYDAGKYTPYSDQLLFNTIDPYSIADNINRGNLTEIVNSMTHAGIGRLKNNFPTQARNIDIQTTQNTIDFVTHGYKKYPHVIYSDRIYTNLIGGINEVDIEVLRLNYPDLIKRGISYTDPLCRAVLRSGYKNYLGVHVLGTEQVADRLPIWKTRFLEDLNRRMEDLRGGSRK